MRWGAAKRSRAGLTLIELLVVVAVIALLVAILLPSLAEARLEAYAALFIGNMRQLGDGFASYTLDNDLQYPSPCEPCPMCPPAIHWSRLDLVVFGASMAEAADAGLNELSVSCESLYQVGGGTVGMMDGVLRDECRALFQRRCSGPSPHPY